MDTLVKNKERDKDRPIIVHCIVLLIQASTGCTHDQAMDAAWNVYDYFGQPEKLSPGLPPDDHKILKQYSRTNAIAGENPQRGLR